MSLKSSSELISLASHSTRSSESSQTQLALPKMQLSAPDLSASAGLPGQQSIAPDETIQFRKTIVGAISRSSRPDCSNTPPGATLTNSLFRKNTTKAKAQKPPAPKHSVNPIAKDPETPPLDRAIDLFCLGNAQVDQHAVLAKILSNQNAVQDPDAHFFKLPTTIRFRVYDYCFNPEPRRINLSPRFAIKAVFPDGYFASPWDVLEPVAGGLQVPTIRRELMIYFWTQYHFHVTISPFTGPAFSPLSSIWLAQYFNIVQYLWIEADLTRFGFGHSKPGAKYGHNVNHVEVLLVGIVKGLATRRGQTTMAELNVMCRRYAGFRPYNDPNAPFDYDPLPYCPNETLYFCDAVINLRGFLQKIRMSGFTKEYAERIFNTIYSEEDVKPEIVPATECPWPPLFLETPTIQKSNELLLELMSQSAFESLPFTPSSSFAEDIKHELLKSKSSLISDETRADNEVTTKEDLPECPKASNIADTVQEYHECVGSIVSSKNSIYSGHQVRDSDAHSGRNLLAAAAPVGIISQFATPESLQPQKTNVLDSRARLPESESCRKLFARAPTTDSRAPTPNSISGSGSCRSLLVTTPVESRSSTPRSPNAMNRRNEQDPAFLRTVDALRAIEDSEKPKVIRKPRPQSMIPSPIRNQETGVRVRSQTSLGPQQRSEGTVRRYLSFVKRLRGGDY